MKKQMVYAGDIVQDKQWPTYKMRVQGLNKVSAAPASGKSHRDHTVAAKKPAGSLHHLYQHRSRRIQVTNRWASASPLHQPSMPLHGH
jgi:hypothetical protein